MAGSKIMREGDFLANGRIDSCRTYFKSAEQKWDELKKETSQFDDFIERFDYQRKLTAQASHGCITRCFITKGHAYFSLCH